MWDPQGLAQACVFDGIQWIPLWDAAGLAQLTPFRILPWAGVYSHSAVWIVWAAVGSGDLMFWGET